MKATLAQWVRDADMARQLGHFDVAEMPINLSYLPLRSDDYYTALVGELFNKIREDYDDPGDWARLGNAFAQFADRDARATFGNSGISINEAKLYAASSFYFGGFPASAYVVLRSGFKAENEIYSACFDLLARPQRPLSRRFQDLIGALRNGDQAELNSIESSITQEEFDAFELAPDQWIPAKLLSALFVRFKRTNVRAVLPEGMSDFWTPLVTSFLSRTPPNWEFFQSQIQAIESGLLTSSETCSLLMPTGSGKTALTETLLYRHLKANPQENAILLVPYRSLAYELKRSLVRRLGTMSLPARSIYGGTVAPVDEVQRLQDVRALVATPESLSALLGATPQFMNRVSLVICDEGHLLEDGSRGISLELLLARLKARQVGPRAIALGFVTADES